MTNKTSPSLLYALSALLSALIISAGFSYAVLEFKSADRLVTVKGLAEQDVKANLAIWPIVWTVSEDDLNKLSTKLKVQSNKIVELLNKSGIKNKEIEILPASIRDQKAGYYNKNQDGFRYIGKGNLAVKSNNITAIKGALSDMDDLLKSGIILGESGYLSKPEYLYTDLNKIKPKMIAQATMNARAAAQQFARDSGSQLGQIQRASQGLFQVFSRDSLTPEQKTVRVVSTVVYRLKG